RAEVDTALRVLATAELAPAAAASLRSLDGEILVELARARRAPALLDSAEARLAESSRAFPATTLPRHASIAWLRQAVLLRARPELPGDASALASAAEALDHASTLTDAAQDTLVQHRVEAERASLAATRRR